MKIQATVEIREITPAEAAEMLEQKWEEQREMRLSHVRRLVADMNRGAFKIAPDAILLINGKLANGQHRMMAVVESGIPQTFIVLMSNDEELYKVIDFGMMRKVGDALKGVMYATKMPTVARWVLAYREETIYRSTMSAASAKPSGGDRAWTQSELIEFCNQNEELLIEALNFCEPLQKQTKVMTLPMGAAVYFIASQSGKKEIVKDFLKKVYVDGGQNQAGDLKNRLTVNRSNSVKMKEGYIFGIVLKSLKAFEQGRRMGTLKWSKDEPITMI